MSRKTTELWRTGIVHAPITEVIRPGVLHTTPITWLPDPGRFRFVADPFGLPHEGGLTVFAEALDYRQKRGEIHYYRYDRGTLTGTGVALREPFHLSYPQIIQDGGETYMLPEAHRSGRLMLYRAECFPDVWRPEVVLMDAPVIDASLIRHDGLWWMFYALPGSDDQAQRELNVAFAESLKGPWHAHPGNPVRAAQHSARPGGTPFVMDGYVMLPTQNCIGGYGQSLSLLRIDRLGSADFAASLAGTLSPDGLLEGFGDGLHTLSAAGEVTLIDVKRLDPSPDRWLIDLQRRFNRLLRA